MKSFNEFIGESQEDWGNWPVDLPEEHYQYIEEKLGEKPVFISSMKQPDNYDSTSEQKLPTLLCT